MTEDSEDSEDSKEDGYLTGQLLVAMPQMLDERFAKSVIYLCAHTEDGAMGLVVNKLLENIDFPDLLDQLDLSPAPGGDDIRVHFGGPVESGRGFVLHTSDYVQDATMVIDDQIAMTATTDILRDIAEGDGPRNSLLALGYAGWGPGQLDTEIQANGWLSVAADDTLVFGTDPDTIWKDALAKMGIDVSMLSGDAGHA
jgi:putative transcriptional regulator